MKADVAAAAVAFAAAVVVAEASVEERNFEAVDGSSSQFVSSACAGC